MLKHITLYFCNETQGNYLGLLDLFSLVSKTQLKIMGKAIKLDIASHDGTPLNIANYVTVNATSAISMIEDTDLLIIPPVKARINEALLSEQQALYQKLKIWHARKVPIMAIGYANFLLAESGILDNRMTIANKFLQEEFSRRYPKIEVFKDRLITTSDEIYSCRGTHEMKALMLFLLNKLANEAVSEAIGDFYTDDESLSVSIENPLLSKFLFHEDEVIIRIQQWLELHFSEAINLEQLASKSNMSLRTFKRRFKEATKNSPLSYIQNLRVAQGKEYLKNTNKTISEISGLVGYEDPGHFNRLFKREYFQTPDQWRKTQQQQVRF